MPTPKSTRWLDLVAFLLYRRSTPVTREEIFAHVRGYIEDDVSDEGESRRRKFERDKDELRLLGIRIETVDLTRGSENEPDKGYRLMLQDFYLPYLELAEGGERPEPVYQGLRRLVLSGDLLQRIDRGTERIAQHAGGRLAAAARSLRQKLAFDLPLASSPAVERLLSALATSDADRCLGVLQRALVSRTAVRCRYYTITRDAEEEREIEPYGLYFTWGKWYCVAHARDREALRVFRVDRMSAPNVVKGRGGRFDVPGDFSVRPFAGRAPWELSDTEPTTVRVRFRFPEARWVQRQGLGEVVEPVLDDGGAVLDFAVRDRNPFLRWILSFRDRADIISPEDVYDELRELRRRVRELYREGDDA